MFRQRPIRSRRWEARKGKRRGLVGLLGIGVIMGMTGLFLMHTNAMATEGFELRGMEYERAELEQEVARLKVQIATARSLEKIAEAVEERNMVAVGIPLFVDHENSVAVNF